MDPVQHIVLHSTGEGTSFWAAVLPVVIGGFLAITASILVQWLQIRFATKIRKKQIQAERETDALEEAYWRLNVIGGLLIPASSQQIAEKIYEHEEWFWRNRLRLPELFGRNWMILRHETSVAGVTHVDIHQRQKWDALVRGALNLICTELGVTNPETGDIRLIENMPLPNDLDL